MDSASTMIERPLATRRRRKVRAERGWQFPLRGILTFTAAISSLLGILRLMGVDGAMVATGFPLFAAVAFTGVALVELSWRLQGGPANVARGRRTR
jgi:hypothetical protein